MNPSYHVVRAHLVHLRDLVPQRAQANPCFLDFPGKVWVYVSNSKHGVGLSCACLEELVYNPITSLPKLICYS